MNDIIKNVKARFDHNRNKQLLKEKYESKLLFAFEGGMWKASPELITTLTLFDTDTIVLEDTYNNPTQVSRPELLELTKQHWQEQMNAWMHELQESSKQR